MINVYGTTETTVHASFREIVDGDVGSVVARSGSPLADRPCSCWISGCGRCRWGWSVSCMWLARGVACGLCGPVGVDGVAVCGVSVRCAGGADVSHRGCGAVGR